MSNLLQLRGKAEEEGISSVKFKMAFERIQRSDNPQTRPEKHTNPGISLQIPESTPCRECPRMQRQLQDTQKLYQMAARQL